MTRICALLLLPFAWLALVMAKADEKTSDTRPAVIIETMKRDNVDVISIHTKGTRVLARSLTLEDGSTIKPYSNEVELISGQSSVRTRKLEIYAKLNIKQIDLVRIEIEPIQN